nr:MAG TPA: hypothetical protein [Caudoviricetes sp.]
MGGGVCLTVIGTVILKSKLGGISSVKHLKSIEIKSYHEDLCKQIKEALGDKVFENDVWAEQPGVINMILTNLTTKDIGELGTKFEQLDFNPDNTEIQAVMTLIKQ